MHLTPTDLETYVRDIFIGHGADDKTAARVAHALVEADRCGHTSHGVRQLPYYVAQIGRGELDVHARLAVVADRGAFLLADGGFGFGHAIAEDAVALAVGRARTQGAAVVAVRNANHVGRLGAYTERAADAGCAAILLVNSQGTQDQQVAPVGGLERRLTNNPISLAAPGGLVLDIALSVAAEGRVHQAAEQGRSLPAGWIVDRDGIPSTDPADYLAGGSLLPAAGHKGYGLIVLVEAIVGMLTLGGMAGRALERFSNAFVLVCIDPGDDARSAYRDELRSLVAWIRSSRRRDENIEILLPGEPEAAARARSTGVDVDAATVTALTDAGRAVSVAPPW